MPINFFLKIDTMLENRNQFGNIQKNKTKPNKTEDAYLYDQAYFIS